MSFSEFSAKLILQRDNTLPLKNEAILGDGALIYDSTKKGSPVPKSNDSKIFVVKGTIVSNLGNQTNAEVVFINQSKLSQPLRVKNKKKHASKPKIKGKVEKKFRITKDIGKTFDDPPSDSQFSYRSSSKAFALLSNFNSPSKKLISVGSFYARAKFCFSISGKSNLEFYLQNKPFFRFLHSLRTRPPPYFTLS